MIHCLWFVLVESVFISSVFGAKGVSWSLCGFGILDAGNSEGSAILVGIAMGIWLSWLLGW